MDNNNKNNTTVIFRDKSKFNNDQTTTTIQSNATSDAENTPKKNEIKINSMKELDIGDHIVLASIRDIESKKFCHAILINLGNDVDLNLIEIIYFDNGTADEFLNGYFFQSSFEDNSETTLKISSGIKRNQIKIDLLKLDVFRIEYEIFKCLSVEETLRKGAEFVGKPKYNLFINNDEHFCIYSKTGKAAKLFILSPELSHKKVIEKSFNNVSSECVRSLAAQVNIINFSRGRHVIFFANNFFSVINHLTLLSCNS